MKLTCCHCGTVVDVADEEEAKKLGWHKQHGKWVCSHCVWDGKLMEDEKCK